MYIQNYNQNSKLVIEKGRKPFAFLIENDDDGFYVNFFLQMRQN